RHGARARRAPRSPQAPPVDPTAGASLGLALWPPPAGRGCGEQRRNRLCPGPEVAAARQVYDPNLLRAPVGPQDVDVGAARVDGEHRGALAAEEAKPRPSVEPVGREPGRGPRREDEARRDDETVRIPIDRPGLPAARVDERQSGGPRDGAVEVAAGDGDQAAAEPAGVARPADALLRLGSRLEPRVDACKERGPPP